MQMFQWEFPCQAGDWTWESQGSVSGGLLLGMHSEGSISHGTIPEQSCWGNRIIMMTAPMSGGLAGASP